MSFLKSLMILGQGLWQETQTWKNGNVYKARAGCAGVTHLSSVPLPPALNCLFLPWSRSTVHRDCKGNGNVLFLWAVLLADRLRDLRRNIFISPWAVLSNQGRSPRDGGIQLSGVSLWRWRSAPRCIYCLWWLICPFLSIKLYILHLLKTTFKPILVG